MRPYFRWLMDPCFHLFVIGIMLFQLGSFLGPDAESNAVEPEVCSKCNLAHGSTLICPTTLPKFVTVAR